MYSHPTSLRRLRNLESKSLSIMSRKNILVSSRPARNSVSKHYTFCRSQHVQRFTPTNVLGGGGAGTVVLAQGEIGCASTWSNPDIGSNSKAHTLDPSSVSLAPLPLYIQSTFANRHPSVFSIVPLLRGLVLVVELPPIVAR